MSFLGKLGPDAIPYDPIVLVTVAAMILGGMQLLLGLPTSKNGATCGTNGSPL